MWNLSGEYRILPLNNSLNTWILSGNFEDELADDWVTHKLMKNPHWGILISPLNNYTNQESALEFKWSYYGLQRGGVIQYPGLVPVSPTGGLGLVFGSYGQYSSLENITIVNPESLLSLTTIPSAGDLACDYTPSNNFKEISSGFRLLLSYADFNVDGYLDHVAIYRRSEGFSTVDDMVICSGKFGDGSSVEILLNESLAICSSCTTACGSDAFPITFPGDADADGVRDLFVGLEAFQPDCNGVGLYCYSVGKSNAHTTTALTNYDWELEPFRCAGDAALYGESYVNSLSLAGDITGDGREEVFVSRSLYRNRNGVFEPVSIADIVDVFNKRFVFRFSTSVTSQCWVGDVNDDLESDFCVISGGSVLCINSQFKVNFTSLQQGQQMATRNFPVTWQTNGVAGVFELQVDGVSNGYTQSSSGIVSLGPGSHVLQIFMFDPSGIIMAMDSVTIIVPFDIWYIILVVGVAGLVTAGYILSARARSRRWKQIKGFTKKEVVSIG